MYSCLFSPIKINTVEIKNRIAYPALGLLYSLDGKINDRYVDFFLERAKGGAGIITVGPVGVDFLGSGPITLSLTSDEAIPSFSELSRSIKKEGSKAWVQLFHSGAYQFPFLINGEKPIAPSKVFSNYSKATPRALAIEEIKLLQEDFISAAERAKEAGFDGVEIIASAGYLITQFLSPLKNLRTDEYGGSFENRTRFPRELIEKMRKRLGSDYPITIRMAGNDFVSGSNTDLETPKIAEVYEKAGVDAINVTGGWHETPVPQLPMEVPRAGFSYLALNIKKVVSIPVIASNRIPDPKTAEKIIRDGVADMVNLGRILIADPQWPKKAMEGRADEIRPCVACSQGCTDMVFGGSPVFCLANPMAGMEGERKINKAGSPKNVMVVGAGPGGLESAITAAQAGHSVELYDKKDDIGGQLRIVGVPPTKQEFFELIRYYRAMIKKLQIKVVLNKEVDVNFIKEKKPDFVIIAEGSQPILPTFEGIEDDIVFTAWEVLKDDPILGRDIAIVGGGSVGLETAHFLADKGTLSPEVLHFLFSYKAESVERLQELLLKGSKNITILEMLPKVGKDVGKSTKWVLMGNIKQHGIKILTKSRVISVKGGKITFEKDGNIEGMQFDNVIIAAGSQSVKVLSSEIEKTGIPFSVVGDCIRPAKINDAIHEGFMAAAKI